MSRADVCHMNHANEQPAERHKLLEGAIDWIRDKAKGLITPLASPKKSQQPLLDVNQRHDTQARRDFVGRYYGLPEGF